MAFDSLAQLTGLGCHYRIHAP